MLLMTRYPLPAAPQRGSATGAVINRRILPSDFRDAAPNSTPATLLSQEDGTRGTGVTPAVVP